MDDQNSATKMMSERGEYSLNYHTFSSSVLARMKDNLYHKEDNPTGVINMGTSVNRLMEKELEEKLNLGEALKFSPSVQYYLEPRGTEKFRKEISAFLNRHFNPLNPIQADELVVMNGLTAGMDVLGHTICDVGDVIITPVPIYGRIFTNFSDRSRITVKALHLSQEPDETGVRFSLTSKALEDRILELKEDGYNVRGFILLNPNNPLGDIYQPDLILNIANVCAKYNMHFIIDEVYALSIYDDSQKFTSSLSLQFPDQDRTHFLWGFSKDFALAGFRMGVIRSTNPNIRRCMQGLADYHQTPSLIQQALGTLITDEEWCDSFFLPTNQMKLKSTYKKAYNILNTDGIMVRKGGGGLYLWVHIAPYLKNIDEASEMELFEEILNAGVYVIPSSRLHYEPGWLRIVFTLLDDQVEQGLARLKRVLLSR